MDEATRPEILCVDDDANQLLAYEALLASLSAQITVADSAEAALRLLETRQFDLLIFDVMMPKTSGFDLATIVRRQFPAMGGTPILFVSALERKLHIDTAVKAGGDDFLTKPVPGKVLREHVSRLLQVSGTADPIERHQAYLKLKSASDANDDGE